MNIKTPDEATVIEKHRINFSLHAAPANADRSSLSVDVILSPLQKYASLSNQKPSLF